MGWTEALEAAYSKQITMEYGAAYSYLAKAAWLDEHDWPGMAAWMRAQSAEEITHALKFLEFVLDRGAGVELGAIAAPAQDFASPLEVFQDALAQEEAVTTSINELYALAVEEQDFASRPLLDWFVDEQVEEEATVGQIVADLGRAEGMKHTLLMLDRELGGRVEAGE
jgi:ferritin